MPGSAFIGCPSVKHLYLACPPPTDSIVVVISPQAVYSMNNGPAVSFKKNQQEQLYAGVLDGVGVLVGVGVGVTDVGETDGVTDGVRNGVKVGDGVIDGVGEGVGEGTGVS